MILHLGTVNLHDNCPTLKIEERLTQTRIKAGLSRHPIMQLKATKLLAARVSCQSGSLSPLLPHYSEICAWKIISNHGLTCLTLLGLNLSHNLGLGGIRVGG